MNELDKSIVAEIERVGFHPFILVRSGGERSTLARLFSRVRVGSSYVVCLTQNEAPQFVNDVAALQGFGDSRLVRGIERALQQETYDAADLMFSWVKGEGALPETLYVGLSETTRLPTYSGYAVFEVGEAAAPTTPRGRANLLLKALRSYSAAIGNDALRHLIIEALGLALSRSFGSLGAFSDAAAAVDLALDARPYSIHLKAARHALGQKLIGGSVTPRLVKFIGDDDGYLKQFVCPEPFSRFDIGPSGEVLVCCGHWLPTSIGDFQNDSVESILNSANALKIRESVTDGTYKYCNHLNADP